MDGVLTIIPHEGDSIPINLGNVENIEGCLNRLGSLETTVNNTLAPAVATLVGADTVSGSVSNKIKTAVEALDATVTSDNGTFVNVTVTQTDGKITAVSVAESGLVTDTDFDDLEKRLQQEITRATTKEGELDTAINTQKGRIDTLVGDGDGSIKKIAYNVLAEELLAGSDDDVVDNFTSLKEIAAWIEEHPEDAAAMNAAIEANTTAVNGLTDKVNALDASKNDYVAADAQVLTDAKTYADQKATAAENNAKAYTDTLKATVTTNTTSIGQNTSDITTIKGQIVEINQTIEENELTIANALNDLNTRVDSLSSSTVSSVTGSSYITTSTVDGAVTVSAVLGAISGTDGLALASDVKNYVDTSINNMWV